MDFEKDLRVEETNVPGLLVFDLPVIGPAARKAGHTVACNADRKSVV